MGISPVKVTATAVRYPAGDGYNGQLKLHSQKKQPLGMPLRGLVVPYSTDGESIAYSDGLYRTSRLSSQPLVYSREFLNVVLDRVSGEWRDFFASLDITQFYSQLGIGFSDEFRAELRNQPYLLAGSMEFHIEPESWASSWVETKQQKALAFGEGRQRHSKRTLLDPDSGGYSSIAKRLLEE